MIQLLLARVAVLDIGRILEGCTGFLWDYFGRLAGLQRAPFGLGEAALPLYYRWGRRRDGLLLLLLFGRGGLGGLQAPLLRGTDVDSRVIMKTTTSR